MTSKVPTQRVSLRVVVHPPISVLSQSQLLTLICGQLLTLICGSELSRHMSWPIVIKASDAGIDREPKGKVLIS